MKEPIGKRIRERRRALDMSQAELSQKSKVSRVYISLIETGHSNDIRVGTLTAIASALGVSAEFFLN